MIFGKKPKCDTCSAKLKKGEPVFQLQMRAQDGDFTMNVCGECARLFNTMIDKMETKEEPGLDGDWDVYDPLGDSDG